MDLSRTNPSHKPISTLEESQYQLGDLEHNQRCTDVVVFNVLDQWIKSERPFDIWAPSVGPSSLNHQREFTSAGASSKHEEWRDVEKNMWISKQEELSLQQRQGSSREMTLEDIVASAEVLKGDHYASQTTRNVCWSDLNGEQHNRRISEEEMLNLHQRHRRSGEMTPVELLESAGIFGEDHIASQSTRNEEAEVAAQNLQSAKWQPLSNIQEQQQLQYNHKSLPSSTLRHPVSGLSGGYSLSSPEVDKPREFRVSKQAKESTMSSESLSTRESHITIHEEILDKRQKRMINNRESANRSRARKQDYINKLLDEVTRIREENARLKKELEELRHQFSINGLASFYPVNSGAAATPKCQIDEST